jgi:hypothetical protein
MIKQIVISSLVCDTCERVLIEEIKDPPQTLAFAKISCVYCQHTKAAPVVVSHGAPDDQPKVGAMPVKEPVKDTLPMQAGDALQMDDVADEPLPKAPARVVQGMGSTLRDIEAKHKESKAANTSS